MKSFTMRAGWRKGAIALVAVGAVGLAGCTTEGPAEGPTGTSVPYGATAEEWQAALADMEPVTLTFQESAPSPDSPLAEASKASTAWIEEMSGGKITVEIAYASAIVPSNDIDLALADGRLDFNGFPAGPEPSLYPYGAEIYTDMTVFADGGKTISGLLTMATAIGEVSNNTPVFLEEFESQGLGVMSPGAFGSGLSGFMCTKPVTSLEDFKGLQIRAGGTTAAKAIEAIGATPVTVPFLETFEAAQRGLVDCIAGAFDFGVRFSWIEAAPYLITLPGTSVATNTAIGLYGADVKALPLPAQQLIYDSQLPYYAASITTLFDYLSPQIADTAAEFGGEILEADAEVIAKIDEANQQIASAWDTNPLLADADYSTKVAAAYEKWTGIIAELGYVDQGTMADYNDWYTPGSMDWTPLFDRIFEEYYYVNRPGA